MSISFKINKVNDSANKPTVFERLGMKSSKTICPAYLKTGKCQLGSKCTYEHRKKEDSSDKAPKSDGSKGHNKTPKESKSKKGDGIMTEKAIKNKESKEKEHSKDTEQMKSSKKRSSKDGEEEKSKSKGSHEKTKSKEDHEKVAKKMEEEKKEIDLKVKKSSKEDVKKKRGTAEKEEEEEKRRVKGEERVKGRERGTKKRRHQSTSSHSSRSSSQVKKSRKEGGGVSKEADQRLHPPPLTGPLKHAFKPRQSPSPPPSRHTPSSHSRRGPDHSERSDYQHSRRGEGGSGRESRREKWEGRRERSDERPRYKSEHKWSDDGYSPRRRSREEDVAAREERALMQRRKLRRSEERQTDFRKDRMLSHASPRLLYRSKHHSGKEAYHSGGESPGMYEMNERPVDGYRGSLRRSRSKSRGNSRYHDRPSSMARGRMDAIMPSHATAMQPLLPAPSSYDFPFQLPRPPIDLQAANKMMGLNKAGLHHGADGGGGGFWEGRRMPGLTLPQFRTPIQHTPYRMPMHPFGLPDFSTRFENRMPPLLQATFAMRPSSPNDELKARKLPFFPLPHLNKPFTTSLEGKIEMPGTLAAAAVVEKARQGMQGFQMGAYEVVSDAELEEEKEVEEEEEEEEDLSGLEEGDDDDLLDSCHALPKKIALVETADVDWGMLAGVKTGDTAPPPASSTATVVGASRPNAFDDVGLSRRLAGEALYQEMMGLCKKGGLKVGEESSNAAKEERDGGEGVERGEGEVALECNGKGGGDESNCDFLDDVALFHVEKCRRQRRMQAVVDMVGGLEQALYARKDLMIRRTLCRLSQEEDLVYPGLRHKPDIYKTAVLLFEN